MTASGQLRLPSCCGECRRSRSSSASPAIVTARVDAQLAVDRLEHVVRLVAAVGESRRSPARTTPLRVGVQLVHRRGHALAAVARAELVDACAARGAARRAGRGSRRGAPPGSASARRAPRSMASSRRVGGMTTPSSRERARDGAACCPARSPPTSAWCARDDGEAERGARDERDVGQVRAAGVRVVEDEDVVGRGVVAP